MRSRVWESGSPGLPFYSSVLSSHHKSASCSAMTMASACSRFAKRAASASASPIKSAVRSSARNPSSTTPLLRRRLLSLSRSQPPQLACAQSLLPLHSAVAAARMTACLTATSRACRALSQELGLSVPR